MGKIILHVPFSLKCLFYSISQVFLLSVTVYITVIMHIFIFSGTVNCCVTCWDFSKAVVSALMTDRLSLALFAHLNIIAANFYYYYYY